MEESYFAKTILGKCINDYLNSKNDPNGIAYNSFFVVIVRMLILIYDELDIVTPFKTGNEELLNSNLAKYGFAYENIIDFKAALQRYSLNPNSSDYIAIEKYLIDMFAKKKLTLDLTAEQIMAFQSIISSPEADNPLIIADNFAMTSDPNEILNYFNQAMVENQKTVIAKAKELLNMGAYQALNYSLDDIEAMSPEEVDELNKRVYMHFNIKDTAINKKYLLDKAIYDLNHPTPAYSTGNGFVDMLFFLSILATIGLVVAVVTIFLL